MKKYIYLIIGLILCLPIITGLNLKPPIDSYNIGYNFGVLMWPAVGIVLIYKFFKLSRKEGKTKEHKEGVSHPEKQ